MKYTENNIRDDEIREVYEIENCNKASHKVIDKNALPGTAPRIEAWHHCPHKNFFHNQGSKISGHIGHSYIYCKLLTSEIYLDPPVPDVINGAKYEPILPVGCPALKKKQQTDLFSATQLNHLP